MFLILRRDYLFKQEIVEKTVEGLSHEIKQLHGHGRV